MADETITVLHEIANSLRRRVEQHDEMAKRSEERLSKMDLSRSERPDLTDIRPDFSKFREEREESLAKVKDIANEHRMVDKQEKAILQEEDRQFKQSMLAEFQRHNNLLEQILTKLTS